MSNNGGFIGDTEYIGKYQKRTYNHSKGTPGSRIHSLRTRGLRSINGLTGDALETAFKDVQRAVNARYDRLTSAKNKSLGENSIAMANLNARGGKISKYEASQYAKGSDEYEQALRSEIRRGIRFLNSDTSTVKGMQAWKQNVIEGVAASFDKIYDYDPEHIKMFDEFFYDDSASGVPGSHRNLGDERMDVFFKLMDEIRERQDSEDADAKLNSDTLIVMAYEYVKQGESFLEPQELQQYIDDVIDELKDSGGAIDDSDTIVTKSGGRIIPSAIEFGRKLIERRRPAKVVNGVKWAPFPKGLFD
ncbi:MAG: hypothetical protein HDS66_05830 [Bacteroidales bacterium]|nr:hypothetical protein [Bacteroidales bacterium]